MKRMCNIIVVDRILAGSIVGMKRVSVSCVNASAASEWENINVKTPVKLTISDKIEDGARLHTAQMTFLTCEDVELRERMVYRCKTVDGDYILIGTNERPYPVTTVIESHPDNTKDNQLNEVSVNWSSSLQIPYLIEV